jgi:hypothetical protein
MNSTSGNIVFVNKKDIWNRRKDLSGVTFRVGYRAQHIFIHEKNNVRFKAQLKI